MLNKIIVFILIFLPSIASSAILFRDNFEYAVGKDDADKSAFVSTGGWYGVKSEPSQNGNGFLYTVTSIDGFSGTFPGTSSSRVLMMNGVPLTEGYQSDFYLQYGNGLVADVIPGNVWFQFWVYIQQQEGQYSQFCRDQQKFLYPCDDPNYPCSSGRWLWNIWTYSNELYNVELDPDDGVYPNLYESEPSVARIIYDSNNRVGNNITNDYLHPNRWYLVKLRFDTSSTNGIYQMWVREQNSGTWVQWANWTGGQGGLTFSSVSPGGHKTIKMPTTWGKTGCPTPGYCYDSWVLLDDFVMAESDADLPVYSDGEQSTTAAGVTFSGASFY